MGGSGYFTRLLAVITACALMGVIIMRPDAGESVIDRMATLAPEPKQLAGEPCPVNDAPLTSAFAPIDDILSVSPLGAVTAPGEPLPAPYIRINTRKGESVFQRRATQALAPSRADITAIERKLSKSDGGVQETWSVHFSVCDAVGFYFDRLDKLDPDLLKEAGGLRAFTELGGPDHLAIETRIRVKAGDVIGIADGFDVGLHDARVKSSSLARPERYSINPYARAAVFDAAPALLEAITTDATKAQCPLNYLKPDLRETWTAKLGDSYGLRRAQGEGPCRTALADVPGTAQGAWFTDASHNAATTKVSAIALAPDTIDQERLIFALHGRIKSLTPEFVALAPMLEEQRNAAAKDFLTFQKGDGRINAPFAEVEENSVYCYNRLRANFVGPRIMGVILLQTGKDDSGAAVMKLEARSDVLSCIDLAEPWAFTGGETTFYR